MNQTTENFWQIWNNLEPYVPPRQSFRLYYDDQGLPIVYSMEDIPGNYIELDPEVFARRNMRVRVWDGKLIELTSNTIRKKIPADTGTPCHPQDVSIVVCQDQPHQCWRTKTHDAD